VEGAQQRLREERLSAEKQRQVRRVMDLERELESGNAGAEPALRAAITQLNELHRGGVQAHST
jgi:hypothetical protein